MGRRDEGRRRERILVAAMTILGEHGLKGFSQLRVAEAAGVQQGHLTYYFRRRGDLLGAVGRRFGEETVAELRATARRGDAAGSVALLCRLARDRARTRLWLGLLAEAEEDAALRRSLLEVTAVIREALAQLLGRDADDAAVELALCSLWGVALGHFLYRERGRATVTDGLVARLAVPPRPARRRPAQHG
jgi:AcrR family transcriptional regulator